MLQLKFYLAKHLKYHWTIMNKTCEESLDVHLQLTSKDGLIQDGSRSQLTFANIKMTKLSQVDRLFPPVHGGSN